MTAHLLLLAQAPTASTRSAAFSRDDEPIADAARLRGKLRPADRHWVSPHRSARETAAAFGVSVLVEPALADCDYGRWRGMTLAEVGAREPEAVAAWLADPEAAPHGGESVAALIARVGGWLQGQATHSGVTLAITHAGVIRAAIVAAVGAPARAFWRFDVAPLGLARLSGHAGQWRLVGLGPLEPAP